MAMHDGSAHDNLKQLSWTVAIKGIRALLDIGRKTSIKGKHRDKGIRM